MKRENLKIIFSVIAIIILSLYLINFDYFRLNGSFWGKLLSLSGITILSSLISKIIGNFTLIKESERGKNND